MCKKKKNFGIDIKDRNNSIQLYSLRLPIHNLKNNKYYNFTINKFRNY